MFKDIDEPSTASGKKGWKPIKKYNNSDKLEHDLNREDRESLNQFHFDQSEFKQQDLRASSI